MTDQELFAAQNYINIKVLSSKEFYADYSKFSMIAKLLRKYKTKKDINYHLILNHFILLFNNFTPHATRTILYSRVDHSLHSALNSFLIFLYQFDKTMSDAGCDTYIIQQLKKI